MEKLTTESVTMRPYSPSNFYPLLLTKEKGLCGAFLCVALYILPSVQHLLSIYFSYLMKQMGTITYEQNKINDE